MNEIKCPKCGTIFKIDEQDYDSIVKQIKDKEFMREINLREEQYEKLKNESLKLAEVEAAKKLADELAKKDLEIANLKNEIKRCEIDTVNKIERKYTEELSKKNIEITGLKSEIKLKDTEKELALKDVLHEKEKEIEALNTKLEMDKNAALVKEQNLKDKYEEKIKDKDEQIAYYKDFKARQSTKMVGESLEQHCSNEFNKLRPLFKNVYFEKDNDVKTGSKGDFIFRENDEDGTEIISIMFEMKNESLETVSKHKNEDFFKELDKD